MLTSRETHDGSVAITQRIIDDFPECFAHDKAQMYFELYIRIKAGIEAICVLSERSHHRLNPTKN